MGNYFFWGKEEYNIDKEVEKFKKKYLDENFSAMNLRYFYSPTYQELSNILHTTGTMFGNIINIINCDEYIFPKMGSNRLNDDELKKLKEELKLNSDNVYNIFTLKIPRDTDYKKTQQVGSKALCKLLQKETQSQKFDEFKNYDKNLFAWIVKTAKEKELTISTQCAQFMVEKSGVNLTLLNSQLEKLKISLYPNTKISENDITRFLNTTEDMYKLADYIVAGRKDLAVLEFQKNCEKNHYLTILSFLQNTFTKWIEIKAGIENTTLAEVAQKVNLHEYVVKLTLQKLNNMSLAQLVAIKKNLIQAEENIKINYSEKAELEIEKAILSDV